MTDRDRIEYLEEVIRELIAPDPEWLDINAELGVRLLEAEAKALCFIKKHSPQIATYDKLMNALFWDRPDCDWPEPKIIKVFISNAKKKIEAAGLPWQIENVWGVGYRYIGGE